MPDSGVAPTRPVRIPAQLALLLLRLYRSAVSPWLGQHCRFTPSCSAYAEQSIQRYGLVRGVFLAARRLLRCHPWNPGGWDPVR